MTSLFQYLFDNRNQLLEQTLEHIGLTFLSLTIAVLLAIPGGILATRNDKLAGPLLGFAGVMQTIPSIALLGFMIPLLGIGVKPAIVALFLYALLPILRNTYTGIQEVAPSVREAAVGMGMTDWQVLFRVELPLAMPVIFAGIRTATVINVGIATLAAYIGAGGLGEFIFGGIALNNTNMILAGAIPAALLAIVFDQMLALLQRLRVKKMARAARLLIVIIPLLSFFYFLPKFFISGLRAGFPPEFMGRADGYRNLVEKYGLDFNTVVLNQALMYRAVRDGYVEVISGYSTDGRIKAYQLEPLQDDRHAFPPYYCAPILRPGLRQDAPEVVEALNLLAERINDSLMTAMNYQVDYKKRSTYAVAREFLEKEGIWRPDRQEGGPVITIGSKIFTEQYILASLFRQLIDGYTDYDVDLRTGLGGTKLCFDALRQGEIDLYPEYTGTGFLVLLTPDTATINRLIADEEGVYDYVSKTFRQRFGIEWLDPIGFNNTYALMVREQYAREKGVERVSDLQSK